MKRIAPWVATAAASVLILSACGGNNSGADDSDSDNSAVGAMTADDCADPDAVTAEITDTLKVGWSGPTSGPLANAVGNAIDLPWSNGQAEGQINRLKTIKRAMYGRAGAELLRARMMPIQLSDLHTK